MRLQSSEDRVAKSKSEPRKTKGEPGAKPLADGPVKRVRKDSPAPDVSDPEATPGKLSAEPADGGGSEKPAKARPAKRAASEKSAPRRASRAEEPARARSEAKNDEEQEAGDVGSTEREEGGDHDPDAEVVEVVGEIIDDPLSDRPFHEEGRGRTARAELSSNVPSVSSGAALSRR